MTSEDIPKAILVDNGKVSTNDQSPGDWLSSAPRGAYTTARTVGRSSIFEFEFHMTRLAKSIKLMIEAEDGSTQSTGGTEVTDPLVDASTLTPLIVEQFRAGMEQYRAPGEVKVTVLVMWDEAAYRILTHLAPLPPLPSHPVKVMALGHPRANAAAKDSEWVRERKVLEEQKPADVNEVLLVEGCGAVLEGMSSNFFAVTRGGELHTAGQGVLEGTVRRLILEVCEREGIPVVLTAPNVKDAADWEGAIVSSTSRLATTIDQLTCHLPGTQEGATEVVHFDAPEVTTRIAELVQSEVEAHSTKVL